MAPPHNLSAPGGRPSGIEAVIAARREGGLPTKEQLQHRLSTITAHLAPREGTPGEVTAPNSHLQADIGRMSLDALQRACDELVEGDVAPPAEPPAKLTAMQMAAELSSSLGIAPSPMTALVEAASAALGIDCTGERPLIDQLKLCYERVAAVDIVGAEASPDASPTDGAASSMAPPTGNSLLDGAYDEEESSAGFAAALAAFRGQPPPPPRPKKGPPLGERLLAKNLVSGCAMP